MRVKQGMIVLVAAVALAALFVPRGQAVAANSAPAIEAFDATFAKINDMTYELHSHEAKGSSVQDRVYQYWFMKPHFAKTLISSGDKRGSGGVWTGEDRVSGHQGGFLAGIHLKVDIHDGRATSLRGYTIPEGLPQSIVATYANVKGELKQSVGGKIDGVQTDVLDLKVSDPTSNKGISEQKLYLSQETHLPLRQILYEGDAVVLDQSFVDMKTNVGLTQNDFPY
jgi:outer membrane lipoprotein-sorting protein